MKVGLLFIPLVLVGAAFAAGALPVRTGVALEADVIARYLSASQQQRNALRGASMEVDIDASVPNLKRTGKLHALRNISKLGTVTYRMLGFNGDNSVKKDVIARYLSAEVQAQSGPDMSITLENYKFKLKGLRDENGRGIYVLALSPRTKQVGLFKGEIWLDRDTYMPLRESGRFVKSPSVFLGKMEFVRTYAIQNGIAVPQRLESMVSTRLFGPVQLNIDFTNFAKDAEPDSGAIASISEVQQ